MASPARPEVHGFCQSSGEQLLNGAWEVGGPLHRRAGPEAGRRGKGAVPGLWEALDPRNGASQPFRGGRALSTVERGFSKGLGPRHAPQAPAAREWGRGGTAGTGRKLGGRQELGEVRWSVPQALQGRWWARHLLDVKRGRRETEQAKTVTPEPRGWEDWGQLLDTGTEHAKEMRCVGEAAGAVRGQGRRQPLCGALSVGSAPAVSGSESITWTLPGRSSWRV